MKIYNTLKITSLLLTITLLFISCSPQQRLYRLLKQHPQLIQLDTTIQIKFDTILPYRTDTTTFILPHTSDPCPDCDSLIRAAIKNNGVSATAGRARATLTLDQNNTPQLIAEQLPDTIQDSINTKTPRIHYQTKYIQKPEKPINTFLRISGIITWITLLLYIAAKTLKNKEKQ